jgi:sugar (pentulose or hexulose) kinase
MSKAPAICALDLGTTAVKAAIVDEGCRLVAGASRPAPPLSDWEGFGSFDPVAYVDTLQRALAELLQQPAAQGADIAGLVVTSQRATVIGLDAGRAPVTPALSWQDASAAHHIAALAGEVGAVRLRKLTGIGPIFILPLAKILRLREVVPALLQRVETFALLPDYLLQCLGGELVTDASNASATGLFDIRRLDWNDELMALARVSREQFPTVAAAGTRVGSLCASVAERTGLKRGTPLYLGGGDQQCATLGAGAVGAGDASLCLGSAAVIEVPTNRPPDAMGATEAYYCQAHVVPGFRVIEAFHNAFGSSLDWGAAMLQCDVPALHELAASSPPGARGVTFYPYLAGIGSPDFDPSVPGTLTGLRLHHAREDIARAVLEGCCLEARRILESLEPAQPVERLIASGNALRGRLLPELLAAVLERPVELNVNPDASLVGAAALAWAGAGRCEDAAELVSGLNRETDVVSPRSDLAFEGRSYVQYRASVAVARGFAGT